MVETMSLKRPGTHIDCTAVCRSVAIVASCRFQLHARTANIKPIRAIPASSDSFPSCQKASAESSSSASRHKAKLFIFELRHRPPASLWQDWKVHRWPARHELTARYDPLEDAKSLRRNGCAHLRIASSGSVDSRF